MKNTFSKILLFSFLSALLMTIQTGVTAQITSTQLIGAWETGTDVKTTRIVTDKHFAVTTYNVKDKQFINTMGGSWKTDGKTVFATVEFHSSNPELVGREIAIPA